MSDAYPFVGASDATIQAMQATQELPTFKEFDWDFENNCFKYDKSGHHVLLEGADALKFLAVRY